MQLYAAYGGAICLLGCVKLSCGFKRENQAVVLTLTLLLQSGHNLNCSMILTEFQTLIVIKTVIIVIFKN